MRQAYVPFTNTTTSRRRCREIHARQIRTQPYQMRTGMTAMIAMAGVVSIAGAGRGVNVKRRGFDMGMIATLRGRPIDMARPGLGADRHEGNQQNGHKPLQGRMTHYHPRDASTGKPCLRRRPGPCPLAHGRRGVVLCAIILRVEFGAGFQAILVGTACSLPW